MLQQLAGSRAATAAGATLSPRRLTSTYGTITGKGRITPRLPVGLRAAVLMVVALATAACGRVSATPVSGQPSTAAPSAIPTASPSVRATNASGTFGGAGALVVTRGPYVASASALLQDGRVLVVGGGGDDAEAAAVELYNPDPGSFSLTGSMRSPRMYPTVTLLADGTVLVAGGEAKDHDPRAELYIPASGTFAPTGALITNRSNHTATLLTDGRVLIAGGREQPGGGPGYGDSGYLTSAEIYDPATGEFTKTGSMKTGRADAEAVRLKDGRVLIVGGDQGLCGACDNEFNPLASAEIYDPATGRFSSAGPMTTSRSGHTATLLGDGRVLVTGGMNIDGVHQASAETYDPATSAFTAAGPMSMSRMGHTATPLAGARVLIAGGENAETTSGTASAEIYDPATGMFSSTGNMTVARSYHLATPLKDGRVLVVGGSWEDVMTFELYWP